MATRPIAPGDITEAHCTKCRKPMNHTIVALVGDRIARVQCNTCGGIHNYRSTAAPAKATAKTAAVKTPAAPRAARPPSAGALEKTRAEWEKAVTAVPRENAKRYEMTGRYKAGELLNHPSFGFGIVQKVMPNKVEVFFVDGIKLLRGA